MADDREALAKMIADEPVIVVNGHRLSVGEAMTVRVACNHFALWLEEEGRALGPLCANYQARLGEVLGKMHR